MCRVSPNYLLMMHFKNIIAHTESGDEHVNSARAMAFTAAKLAMQMDTIFLDGILWHFVCLFVCFCIEIPFD